MSKFTKTVGEQFGRWLAADGPEAGIVLSSRARVARNLPNMMFAHRATSAEQRSVIGIVMTAVEKSGLAAKLNFIDFDDLDSLQRHFLMERYAISREMAVGSGEKALFLSPDQTVSLMINEEDHLRVQCLQSGCQLRNAWREVDEIDDQLERRLEFAFSEDWGFLTACPSNVGTGLRASVMVHLPALVMSHKVASAVQAVSKSGCAVRGLHGEGTDMTGDLFQVSNQVTLGRDEGDLVESVERIALELVVLEKQEREALLSESRRQTEDRIERALGLLKRARILGLEETMSMLSALRLGVCLELVADCSIKCINELMIQVQPAHLQMRVGEDMDALALDSLRADVVKGALS